MSYYARNHLQNDWDREQAEDEASRIAACEAEVASLFDAAVAPYRAERNAAFANLLGMVGPRWNRARDAVEATFKRDTAVARALFDASVEWMLSNDAGELSDDHLAQWDALIADAEAVSRVLSAGRAA